MCNSCEDNKVTVGVPEEQWTKSQREFVGTQFPTPKGGVLTVTGVKGKQGNITVFGLECSVCSKDIELFPDNFSSTKNGLVKGQIPCGCAKNPRWKEWQNRIRVQRECNKRGYIFHGWYGEYIGSKTKAKIHNSSNRNTWYPSLKNFIRGCGDPLEGFKKISDAKSLYEGQHIQEFYKAGFSDGYKFWKSDRLNNRGYKTYWEYTCPTCSNDKYVQNGLCTGIFSNTTGDLKNGMVSCRCSKNYKWTQEQREYQINKICIEECITFLGWETEEGYVNTKGSNLKWLCSEGHQNLTNVNDFLNCGNRCMTCKKQDGSYNGYFPHRKDEKDFLYIINFNNKYIKVGRAFSVDERFKGNKGLLKCSKVSRENIKILQVFTSNHQRVYDTEQWLHSELRERGFEYNKKDGQWSIELFDMDSLPVLDYLLQDTDLEDVSDEFKD
ncbi:endonuclease [Vibrio phage PWH3a-P1]|uniref:endonuclease n=1 Tax=Vibrio phage PWH3a-P1 TaxID=754058 RepID=UPI0002C08239|nr:endonuclease [Vibrio phage PWH3a-P1]AGH32043.1 hypothetical protein VPIG_00187 [Vibrio phage PWH3a-P1]